MDWSFLIYKNTKKINHPREHHTFPLNENHGIVLSMTQDDIWGFILPIAFSQDKTLTSPPNYHHGPVNFFLGQICHCFDQKSKENFGFFFWCKLFNEFW
jgi:hypothetical protein